MEEAGVTLLEFKKGSGKYAIRHRLRIIGADRSIWVVLSDAEIILGPAPSSLIKLMKARQETRTHPVRVRGGRNKGLLLDRPCLTVDGLRRLAIHSRRPIAREFLNWFLRTVQLSVSVR